MQPVIPPRFVSLIGLPGSGKTTLCRSLAKALDWPAFVIGDALRARAASDWPLQEMLDRGELAPENIAIELMRNAAEGTAGKGLVIDGFPRHRDQVELAQQLFAPWLVVCLEVPPSIAGSRLGGRLFCPSCNWVGSKSTYGMSTGCPQCGSHALRPRPEDEPALLGKRIGEAEERLAELLIALRKNSVLRLDATKPRDEVLQEALAAFADSLSAHET